MIATECKCLSCFKSLLKTPFQHKKLFLVIVLLLLFHTFTRKNVSDNHIDYVIFSQRWLPTACIEYIEHHSSSDVQHHCILPKNYDFWAIHGLWPTKINNLGPFFCNKTMAFDVTKLKPIETELKLYWPNIEEGKNLNSLWKHEWDKHGTCALQLKLLDSEFKYFSTTLKFFKTYSIENVLKKNNIEPSPYKGINVTDLFYVIKNEFGKLPQIHCMHEMKTERPYLSEIRLCFNKNLELMDCGNIKSSKWNSNLGVRNILTNCPLNVEIIYPKEISPKLHKLSLERSSKMDYYDLLVRALTTIRFFQWLFI